MKVREHRENLVSRVPLLQVAFVALLVLIAGGYWFVQVVRGDYYRVLADNNRLRKLPIRAPRGLIYDRQGRLLVRNVAMAFDAYLPEQQRSGVRMFSKTV